MATPDLPKGHSPDHSDEGSVSSARHPDLSRLEKVLTKSSIWKKQALRKIESDRAAADTDSDDRENKAARVVLRLSAQIQERNDEIERLREAVSRLENEKLRLDRACQREMALHQADLERMQDAYDQFEKESDSLLSELDRQNERLRNECRRQNGRSLLE